MAKSGIGYWQKIFGVLLVMNLCFLGISVVFKRLETPTLNYIIADLLMLGVFYVILFNFDTLDGIIYGIRNIAHGLTGVNTNLTAPGVFAKGWKFLLNSWTYAFKNFSPLAMIPGIPGGSNPAQGLIVLLCGIIIAIGFGGIALEYAFISVQAIMYLIFGPFFLSFMPIVSLREIGEKYLAKLFHLGIRLLVFFVMLGFSLSVINPILHTLQNTSDFIDVGLTFSLCFMSILSVYLLAKLPEQFANDLAPSRIDISEFISKRIIEV